MIALAAGFGAGRANAGGRSIPGGRALVLAMAAQAAPQTQPAIADAAHLEDGSDRATLTFDLSHPVDADAFVLAKPNRVVIDLPAVDFQLNPQIGSGPTKPRPGRHAQKPVDTPAAGLIASYRFGLFAPGKSRIVIDLTGPARILRASSEPLSQGGKARLTIELAKTDRAAFQAAANKALMTAAAEPAPKGAEMPSGKAAEAESALPIVVVDPGHGGVDSGAMVDGLVEKNIVFEFAKELASKLEATGRYKVVMTRDSDVYIPLGGRVKIAREAHAALFVSIHADTISSDTTSVSGATIYTMSDRASDAEAARTAEKENQADATAGVEGKEEPSGVSDILFDLTRRETRAYSHVFARTLVNYWRVAGRLNKNPERAAGFRVLTAPDVPSVLLELGYLSNVKDAKSLVSPEWRDETSGKVVAAINAFFDSRGPTTGQAAPIEPAVTGSTAPARVDAAAATTVSK
ncbi:MAG: N-acetylmuramoyl-L-alanine amidase [Methylovirgula sp.]